MLAQIVSEKPDLMDISNGVFSVSSKMTSKLSVAFNHDLGMWYLDINSDLKPSISSKNIVNSKWN